MSARPCRDEGHARLAVVPTASGLARAPAPGARGRGRLLRIVAPGTRSEMGSDLFLPAAFSSSKLAPRHNCGNTPSWGDGRNRRKFGVSGSG